MDAIGCIALNTAIVPAIPPLNCDDNNCNTADSYDTATCQCVNAPITPPTCDDNNCNTADSYDTATCQCVNAPITPPSCDDNNCNTVDSYNEQTCECEHGNLEEPNCDDGDEGTIDTYNGITCQCEHSIVLLDNKVLVPNAFSPNGDGVNDVFKAQGNNIASLKLIVYNRWGQVVFEGNDLHTGWDGTLKGQPQPISVYVYYLTAAFEDGKTHTEQGNITLIR